METSQTETKRLELHTKLKEVCNNCYFTPLESIKMVYPAIVYNESNDFTIYADNLKYMDLIEYTITIICNNPVTASVMQDTLLSKLGNYSSKETTFISDNLYHKVIKYYT